MPHTFFRNGRMNHMIHLMYSNEHLLREKCTTEAMAFRSPEKRHIKVTVQ